MRPDQAHRQTLQRLLPTLVRIQAHMEGDLSLSHLAERAGLSPTHFHRLFRELTGETPKQYCLRLRLERSAFRLLVQRATITEVALDCGFKNHETFTRAFRRRFGISPRQHRAGVAARRKTTSNPATTPKPVDGFELSRTVVRELQDIPVAFIRHVGPYEAVPTSLWDRLRVWATRRSWGDDPWMLGVAQDAPGITPPEKLRFDAAIRVPERFAADGQIGFQLVAGGPFAITMHVGTHATLAAAVRMVAARIEATRRHRLVGLPFITQISAYAERNQTEMLLPVALR